LAFDFLPTRAHERYLFPAVALLVPFAASRWRALPGWVVLSVGYGVTLIFALVRTVYTDVAVPASIDSGLFARPGQFWIAVVMCLSAVACAALVSTVDRTFAPHPLGWADAVRARWSGLRWWALDRSEALAARVLLE